MQIITLKSFKVEYIGNCNEVGFVDTHTYIDVMTPTLSKLLDLSEDKERQILDKQLGHTDRHLGCNCSVYTHSK